MIIKVYYYYHKCLIGEVMHLLLHM